VTPCLSVGGLRIRRKGRVVLDGFDFTHGPGRLAWVTGENGAGKSSLLRVLANRLRPEAGTVGLEPAGATLVYYHPGMALPRDARVGDWFRLLGRADATDLELAPTVGPGDAIARLSTGERKRLLLAGILSRSTPFTFLDEPYEHLSPEAKMTLTRILLERARSGVVVVATNQDVPAGGDPLVIRVDGGPDGEVDVGSVGSPGADTR
jgi:heme exporter protein A